LGVYKSVENIQKKYPKMINFLTNLIMNWNPLCENFSYFQMAE
jgi:hypothetical protein